MSGAFGPIKAFFRPPGGKNKILNTIRMYRPVRPPIKPPENATTGVWQTFETRRKLFDTFSAAASLLLRRIFLTLPAADNNLLSHPILGLVNFSAFALMEHLRMTYGTFQATDFQQLYLHLEQIVSSATDFFLFWPPTSN